MRIAVAQQCADVAGSIECALDDAGFIVETYERGDTAYERISAAPPDLAILGLSLPGMAGFELCRRLKRTEVTAEVPLVILSGESDPTERIVAYELGVDDYITTPFNKRELVLRVQSILKHKMARATPRALDGSTLRCGPVVLYPEEHRLIVNGEETILTRTECRLLQILMSRATRSQLRRDLIEEIWGDSSSRASRSLDVYVYRLRRKLGPAATRLETVSGIGYRFRG